MVPAISYDESAQQKVETLIHDQRENAAKNHSVPDKRDISQVEAREQLVHHKQQNC